jgi:hypothetical protein
MSSLMQFDDVWIDPTQLGFQLQPKNSSKTARSNSNLVVATRPSHLKPKRLLAHTNASTYP